MVSRRRQKYIFAKPKKSEKIMKGLLVLLLVVAIAVVGMFIYFNLFGTASKVHLKDKLEAEINSQVQASDFITSIDDGGEIHSMSKIDTSKLGKTECEVQIKFGDNIRDFAFDVEIVDTTAPVIQCEDTVNILKDSKIDLVTLAGASDNSQEKIKVKADKKIDVSTPGTYDVTFTTADSSENKASKAVKVTVIDPASIMDSKEPVKFYTDKGFAAEFKDGVLTVAGIPVANKSFGMYRGYAPGVNKDAAKALGEMQEAASKAGFDIFVQSSYRSFGSEYNYYNRYVNNKGQEEADKYEAKPGFSEHQTGLAFDLNASDSEFDSTPEAKWLAENCYKYGFVIRYPQGKDAETGYAGESWHFRYVGKELAEKLYNGGKWITLEEYFGLPSVYYEAQEEEN